MSSMAKFWLTYGRVAIDSEEREICSRWRSSNDIVEKGELLRKWS